MVGRLLSISCGCASFGGSFHSGTLAAMLWVGTTNGDVAAIVVNEIAGSQDGSPRKLELMPTSMWCGVCICTCVWCVHVHLCVVCAYAPVCGVCICTCVWCVHVHLCVVIVCGPDA